MHFLSQLAFVAIIILCGYWHTFSGDVNETLNAYCHVNIPIGYFVLDTSFLEIGHYKSAGARWVFRRLKILKISPVKCFKICHAN